MTLLKVHVKDKKGNSVSSPLVKLLYPSGVKAQDRLSNEAYFYVDGEYVIYVKHPAFDPFSETVFVAEKEIKDFDAILQDRTVPPEPEEPPTIDWENLTTTLDSAMTPIIRGSWKVENEMLVRYLYANKAGKLIPIDTQCKPL